MRVITPQLRPELRKPGAGAAVPDPAKVRANGCLDEPKHIDGDPLAHVSALSDETRAKLAERSDDDQVEGERFALLVEVRLTKHSVGGQRGRRITADIVQALLDRSVADHAVAMHATGQPPKVAGFTVVLLDDEDAS